MAAIIKEGLKRLGMLTLRSRRLRGDMIIHGIDMVNIGKLFCIDEDGRTRKHCLCLKIRRRKLKYWIEVFH